MSFLGSPPQPCNKIVLDILLYSNIELANFVIKACLLGRCLGQVGCFSSIPEFSSVHMRLPFLLFTLYLSGEACLCLSPFSVFTLFF